MPNPRNPILDSVRIIPREQDFLNRKIGARGEVFFDNQDNTLRLFDGTVTGGIPLLRADLENLEGVLGAALSDTPPVNPQPGTIWFNTSNGRLFIYYNDGDSAQWVQPTTPSFGAGGGTGSTSLNGLTDVVITSPTANQVLKFNGTQWINDVSAGGSSNLDALTDVAISSPTSNQVLSYNGTSWVNATLSGGGVASNSFANIAVSGRTTVVADSASDTLTLVAGSGVTITTDATTDSITISADAAGTFGDLTEITEAALTVDKIYLPAITMLTVSNSGATAYRFDQYGTANNPTIYAINATTIAFNLQATGHPFLIQDPAGTNYNTGLVHVSTTGVVSTGAAAQGKSSGTLYWKIPESISGGYRYQCGSHVSMVGAITIKNFGSI